jgi:DNA-directed RNA polymerase subunit RPC12/RpoP
MSTSSKKPGDQLQDNLTGNSDIKENDEWEYELPLEEDAFIPLEEWSKSPEINQEKEVSAAKQIKNTIETIAAEAKNMKNCPYCSNEIELDAVKCDHCGRRLNQKAAKRIFL